MIDIFLPYTAFHIASFLRTLRSGIFRPKKLYILIGFGTTHTISGQLYLDTLSQELSIDFPEIEIHITNAFNPKNLFLLISLCRDKYRFITGNPRRTPSLVFSRNASAIHIVDEGTGTTKYCGYFDPLIKECSLTKRLFQSINLIPSYSISYPMIKEHSTIFSNSIFPNPNFILFTPGIWRLPFSLPVQQKLRIFVCSSAHIANQFQYIKWAKHTFFTLNSQKISKVYFAPHPAHSIKLIYFLMSELSMEILPSAGVLLEDYIYHMLNADIDIELIGESNTSTLILESLASSNLTLSVQTYTGN